MAEHVQFCGIEEQAALLVAQEGVIRPGVPQSRHDIEELAATPVAGVVLDMFVEPEVHRLVRVAARHEVPARPAVADVVERGELAGHMVGFVVGGGGGGDQPDAFGDHGEGRQQRQRIEGGHGGAAPQGRHGHVEKRQVIGHEERVELGLLQRPGEAHEVADVRVGVGPGAGIAPPGRVNPHRPHERAEV